MRVSTTVIIAALLTLAAAPASAETPYSAKAASISQLIQPARFKEVPIAFPDFTLTNTKSVATPHGRLDYELYYDVDYWEFVEWMEKNFRESKMVSALNTDVFPYVASRELKIVGRGESNGYMRFSMSSPQLPYRFDLRIRSDDQSKAVVVFGNALFATIYSGVTPSRAPFKPAGETRRIRFRWN